MVFAHLFSNFQMGHNLCFSLSPVVICPNDTIVSFIGGMPDEAVIWSPLPSAIDSAGGVIDPASIVCEDQDGNLTMSGDIFPAGKTSITCTTDINDTVPYQGYCQFTITLRGRCFNVIRITFCHSCVQVRTSLLVLVPSNHSGFCFTVSQTNYGRQCFTMRFYITQIWYTQEKHTESNDRRSTTQT